MKLHVLTSYGVCMFTLMAHPADIKICGYA